MLNFDLCDIQIITAETFSAHEPNNFYLRVLNLANNLLTRLANDAFSRLVRLRYLDLSGNELDTVQSGLFDHNVQLKYLNLSNNYIRYMEYDFGCGTPMLKSLSLANNFLDYFYRSSLGHVVGEGPPTLVDLNLSGNKLMCSCDLLYLREDGFLKELVDELCARKSYCLNSVACRDNPDASIVCKRG